MKKNIIFELDMGEDIARKIAYISEEEGQSVRNQILFLIRQKISYYEKVKGRISQQETAGVSLDGFKESE